MDWPSRPSCLWWCHRAARPLTGKEMRWGHVNRATIELQHMRRTGLMELKEKHIYLIWSVKKKSSVFLCCLSLTYIEFFFFFNPNTLITVLTKDPSQCQTFKHTQKQDAASVTGVIVEHLEHIHSSLETKRKQNFFFLIPTFLKAFKCIFNFNLMLKMSQCFLIFIYFNFFCVRWDNKW